MNQEIDCKLNDIGTELHLRPSQIERLKKAVSELVCSTVPKKRNSPSNIHPHAEIYHDGWNDFRTEILKKWS